MSQMRMQALRRPRASVLKGAAPDRMIERMADGRARIGDLRQRRFADDRGPRVGGQPHGKVPFAEGDVDVPGAHK